MRPREGAFRRPYATRTFLIPKVPTLRAGRSLNNVPQREHSAAPEGPEQALHSSGAEPAFRRRGSACPPGRRHPGAAGPAPALAGAPGALGPVCGPQSLTCPPRRLRPSSERSSRSLQRAPGTHSGSERLPALARLLPPIGCPSGTGLAHWRVLPSPDTGGAQTPRVTPDWKVWAKAKDWVCTSSPSQRGSCPSLLSLQPFQIRGSCSLQQPITELL